MRANEPSNTDILCEECGRPMQVHQYRVFLGCSSYALSPKERCKSTINLVSGDEVVSADGDEEAESRILLGKERCGECGTAMDSYLVDESRNFMCVENP